MAIAAPLDRSFVTLVADDPETIDEVQAYLRCAGIQAQASRGSSLGDDLPARATADRTDIRKPRQRSEVLVDRLSSVSALQDCLVTRAANCATVSPPPSVAPAGRSVAPSTTR